MCHALPCGFVTDTSRAAQVTPQAWVAHAEPLATCGSPRALRPYRKGCYHHSSGLQRTATNLHHTSLASLHARDAVYVERVNNRSKVCLHIIFGYLALVRTMTAQAVSFHYSAGQDFADAPHSAQVQSASPSRTQSVPAEVAEAGFAHPPEMDGWELTHPK